MKTLLVLSDSHRAVKNLLKACKIYPADILVFLGDGLRDLEQVRFEYPSLEVLSVRGNNDFSGDAPSEFMLELYNKRIFVTHGHNYGVKTGLSSLKKAASDHGADIVLFGHTHIPHMGFSGNMLMFNPGSVSAILKPTCGILRIYEDKESFAAVERL